MWPRFSSLRDIPIFQKLTVTCTDLAPLNDMQIQTRVGRFGKIRIELVSTKPSWFGWDGIEHEHDAEEKFNK